MAKNFALGDILSITTGRLVSPRHIAGVYDILNYMTNDNLFTHQLLRVSDECRPHLLTQHPQLQEVDASRVTPQNWRKWIGEQVRVYGTELPVEKLADGVHYFIDPMSELAEKVHPDKIIVVDAHGQG